MNKKTSKNRTSQNLSSTTLFHLTNSMENLESIIKNGFQARYIYEKIPNIKLAYFTKTVCLCNIPLGSIKEHLNWYGDYGLGINREYAKKQKCTPVFYIHSQSPFLPPRSNIAKSMEWYEHFTFTPFFKQIFGKQRFTDENGDEYFKEKRFYNEKEWRYFPEDNKTEVKNYNEENDLEAHRKVLNENLNGKNWVIEPEMIEYIIIRDAQDMKTLKPLLKKSYPNDVYEDLLTKIITSKQILKDF